MTTETTFDTTSRDELYRMVNGAANHDSFGAAREMLESGDLDDLIESAGHDGDSAREIIEAATGYRM